MCVCMLIESIVFFCWKKLNPRITVHNWQLFETKQPPSNYFRLRRAEPKERLEKFSVPKNSLFQSPSNFMRLF
jgi:hypothetical protein